MKLFGGKQHTAQTSHLAANLQDEKLKFEVIINTIEDGVLLVDSQGVIQLCNPGASRLLGWDCKDANGINVERVMNLIDDKGKPLESTDNPFVKILADGNSVRGSNTTLKTRDGKEIALNLSITALLDDQQQVNAAVAIFSDVSQQRAQEQQRADFISTASHEMRTPVAAIEGYLALALNEKVSTIDARARGYLDKAHSSTQHLGKLFQDLLTSAKAEDGRLTSHPSVVELGSFLEQLTNDLKMVAEKKGLFMEFSVGSSNAAINATQGDKVIRPLYYIHTDPDRLREVITNLFDNAVKYTPEGKVSIGLTGNNDVAQCYVKDTGPGIPKDDLPHLFQKFYRVDNSATRTIGGTGLGLFICRKIIELYGGRIWAESEVGKGSIFYINMPRLTNEKAHALQQQAAGGENLQPLNNQTAP